MRPSAQRSAAMDATGAVRRGNVGAENTRRWCGVMGVMASPQGMAGSRIIDQRFDMDVVTIPATAAALVLRLILAAALGAAVGVNRELRHEPAGLRTHALVALGAALLTVIGLALTGVNGGGDPSA